MLLTPISVFAPFSTTRGPRISNLGLFTNIILVIGIYENLLIRLFH